MRPETKADSKKSGSNSEIIYYDKEVLDDQ